MDDALLLCFSYLLFVLTMVSSCFSHIMDILYGVLCISICLILNLHLLHVVFLCQIRFGENFQHPRYLRIFSPYSYPFVCIISTSSIPLTCHLLLCPLFLWRYPLLCLLLTSFHFYQSWVGIMTSWLKSQC